MTKKTFGYARVSTDEQNLDMQIRALTEAGCDQVFSEHKSGTSFKRKQLNLLSKHIREGDTLMVWKLDRLGRNNVELQNFVERLNERGVHFRSLQDSIDTSTAMGKVFFQFLCAMAEMESNLTRERTRAGLAAYKARGGKMGRPTKITGELREQIEADLRDLSMTVREVAAKHGYAANTLNNHFPGVRAQALRDAKGKS